MSWRTHDSHREVVKRTAGVKIAPVPVSSHIRHEIITWAVYLLAFYPKKELQLGIVAGVPPTVGRSVTHMEDGMKRLSLILAVSVFAGVAGSAVAQTELGGKAGKVSSAERHTSDRTEEERRRPDRQESAPTVTREWLSEPPGAECRNDLLRSIPGWWPQVRRVTGTARSTIRVDAPFVWPHKCGIALLGFLRVSAYGPIRSAPARRRLARRRPRPSTRSVWRSTTKAPDSCNPARQAASLELRVPPSTLYRVVPLGGHIEAQGAAEGVSPKLQPGAQLADRSLAPVHLGS